MKKTAIMLAMLLAISAVSAFSIVSPENKIYNETEILFSFSGEEQYNVIYYVLDNGPEIFACSNCKEYNNTLNLSEGNYTLIVYAEKTNELLDEDTNETINQTTFYNDSVSFKIKVPVDEPELQNFTMQIVKPTSATYIKPNVPVRIIANETLDSIKVRISGFYSEECKNCSEFIDTLNLTDGNYTMQVTGKLGHDEKKLTVKFEVKIDEKKYNGTSKYSTGFEKLPQILESGEIDDDELAEIIRENKLNPGIINRLIKTGLLGEESIEAILDTQSPPPGIFRKFLSFIGIKSKTYASQIYEEYDLTPSMKHKMLSRDDLPKKYVEEVKNHMQNQIKEKTKTRDSEISDGYNAGSQGKPDFVPPGLAKKDNPQITGKAANPGKGNKK